MIKRIRIEPEITTIEACAFYGCSELAEITIPNGVTKIGEKAFKGCSGLTKINIPDGVTEIRVNAFDDCDELEINIGYQAYQRLKDSIPKEKIKRNRTEPEITIRKALDNNPGKSNPNHSLPVEPTSSVSVADNPCALPYSPKARKKRKVPHPGGKEKRFKGSVANSLSSIKYRG